MSIFINKNTKVLVQGITGRDGSFHTQQMLEYGTQVVGGVTPGKGGMSVAGVPVFNKVKEAQKNVSANTSIIFVPAAFSKQAILEAIEEGINLIVCITEGIPLLDMVEIKAALKNSSTQLIGPNCPGLISPGQSKVGIMSGAIHQPGTIGVISRSGTLTYEVVAHLSSYGLGQSTCIGLGGDPILGTRFVDALTLFMEDDATQGIVLVGEIGGQDEQIAAEYIQTKGKKPIVAFIAGKTAPQDKRMGHAGAIISSREDTAEIKIKRLKEAGVQVVDFPNEIPVVLKKRVDFLE